MNQHNIHGVDIPHSTEWKKIAISLSGGADSALLAYIICTLASANNTTMHIISHSRMWKTKPWQQWDSLKIYDYLVEKFPQVTFVRHTNFVPPDLEWCSKGPNIVDEYGKLVSGDIIELRSFAEYICHHNSIDAYYNAVNRNPRNQNFGGMHTRDIEPTEDNKQLLMKRHMNFWALHPLRFTEKSWVTQMYASLNIMDLFEMTRSCEGEIEGIDYTNYVPRQYVPVCNECFWCKERAWAIEQSK